MQRDREQVMSASLIFSQLAQCFAITIAAENVGSYCGTETVLFERDVFRVFSFFPLSACKHIIRIYKIIMNVCSNSITHVKN